MFLDKNVKSQQLQNKKQTLKSPPEPGNEPRTSRSPQFDALPLHHRDNSFHQLKSTFITVSM